MAGAHPFNMVARTLKFSFRGRKSRQELFVDPFNMIAWALKFSCLRRKSHQELFVDHKHALSKKAKVRNATSGVRITPR